MKIRTFKFKKILEILIKHDVKFVIVGGVSAVLYGAMRMTFDLDIVHSRSDENIKKLLKALKEINAHYRGMGGKIISPKDYQKDKHSAISKIF